MLIQHETPVIQEQHTTQKPKESRPKETIVDLFSRYIRGPIHMHTVGKNPEGGLEATLTLEQQLSYLGKIASASNTKEAFPLEFTTVTNHAEHLGLNDDHLEKCIKEGTLTLSESELIKSGREKRKIPKNDPRAIQAVGNDGWGLCTLEENSAMAKSAALELQQTIATCKEIQNRYPTIAIHPGVEASITRDGSLTIQDTQTLKDLDIVVASPHASGFDHIPLAPTPEELVAIYTKVAETQPILILGHPFIDKPISSELVQRLSSAGWTKENPQQNTEIAKQVLEPLMGNLLTTMAKKGIAWELNLKSPVPSELQEALIILLESHKTPISISVDGHQIQQWRKDEEVLSRYKANENMTDEDKIALDATLAGEKAVGVPFLLRLTRLLKQLETHSVHPEQVITSSEARLKQAIALRKSTFN